MVYYLLGFGVLAAWSLLRHLGTERACRLAAIEAQIAESGQKK